MKFYKSILLFLIVTLSVSAQDSVQTFLSLKSTGVLEFRNTHPDYDGRGAIIFILDTGVDVGIEGLIKTSTGEIKVVDIQDFTGQGDIKLYAAELEKENDVEFFYAAETGYKVAGAGKLPLKSADGKYFIGMLPESLWMNSTAGTSDINGDGDTADKFYMAAFETENESGKYWVVFFDTNCDNDLSDEKPIRNYKENYDMFFIPNKNGLPLLHFGLNIFPYENRVNIFFDDGAHGTHCAGISAGYKIGGEKLNGVAPGAKVIGLKIGDNNYSGGASVTESMKKAFLYADKISKEKKEICIINMSYGIGSEIEGRSDLENFIGELVDNNPYLYIFVSNGNEGPGISTTGLPSSSNKIFSTGAVLTTEIGSDLYGAVLDKDVILDFSSRGGEVNKPDVIAPGACASTIPNWGGWDRFWGTSMASPYSAGVAALLLSAALKEFPDVKIPSFFLYKILRESAVKMDGYDHLDQGSGYINVMNAYALLKKYIKNGELNRFETYSISSIAPNMPDGRAQCLYLRDGSFLTGGEVFPFNIFRDNYINKNQFNRTYILKSTSDWLMPVQKKTYLRNEQSTTVDVKFDVSKMIKPGLYNAKIIAYRADASNTPEFELQATVIMPYKFDDSNNYSMNWRSEVDKGMVERYFVRVPAGASAMKITLSAVPGSYSNCKINLHDIDGRQIYDSRTVNPASGVESVSHYEYDLIPGVYEIDIEGFFLATSVSDYILSVEFEGIDIINDKTLTPDYNKIVAVNVFDKIDYVRTGGEILGFIKQHSLEMIDKDIIEIPFKLYKNEKSKEFDLTLSKEDYNKVTDFAVEIFNEQGEALVKSSLSYSFGSISITNRNTADSTDYVLFIRPGFANKSSNIVINIEEKTLLAEKIDFQVKQKNSTNVVLYPAIPVELECGVFKPDFEIPSGSKLFGRLFFKSQSTGEIKTESRILFEF